MNFWCRILGHTWTPDTTASDAHWHTTKKMDVLELLGPEADVLYFDRCIRCDERREVQRPAAAVREDAARASEAASASGEAATEDESTEDEDEDEAADESVA